MLVLRCVVVGKRVSRCANSERLFSYDSLSAVAIQVIMDEITVFNGMCDRPTVYCFICACVCGNSTNKSNIVVVSVPSPVNCRMCCAVQTVMRSYSPRQ